METFNLKPHLYNNSSLIITINEGSKNDSMTDSFTSSLPWTTPTKYAYVYWPFSSISVFCFCLGVPANLFSAAYFLSSNTKRPTHVSLLYIFMNTVDLMICLLCLPMAMTNLSNGKKLFFSVSFLCNMWGYLWQILIRLSVFAVGLMSICRTISLSLPFLTLKKRHILIPAVIYLVVLLIQQSIPWWFGLSYVYDHEFSICAWFIWYDGVLEHITQMFLILMPFILPLFLIVISCLISVIKLKTDTTHCDSGNTEVGNEHRARDLKSKRSVTFTIVILTVTYIVFNLPYCLVALDQLVYSLSEEKANIIRAWFNSSTTPYYNEIFRFLIAYSVPLNSTINPIIYILRIGNLRRYIWNILTCRRYIWNILTCRRYADTAHTISTVGNNISHKFKISTSKSYKPLQLN